MNKRFHYIMSVISGLPYLIIPFSLIFRNSLSYFALSFCGGLSFVLVVTSGIYRIIISKKRKNHIT